MPVGLIYDPIFLKHDTGAHVENRNRLIATVDLLRACSLLEKLVKIEPRLATQEELLLVHSEKHVERVRSCSEGGGCWLDGDTYASPESYEVALYAVGGVLNGLQAVMEGTVDSAFALVRPPGHHATEQRAMGFCLFNNIAIAAKYALERYKLKKVLIVDFDVHHGNGTEEIFYHDRQVLYFSTHQYPYYPGTGSRDETGTGEAKGTTLNVPMYRGADDKSYREVYETTLVPAARKFQPELILVSAGYDGHWADPLAGMQLSVKGYCELTAIVKNLASELCNGRMLFSLEGGYDLTALSHSIRGTLEVLMGLPISDDPLGVA
ncbi:MAG: histone deacetylase [Deltaproteobacteria bacterium]|nr:histone deacetylase [Deltaproteobacteria bacterium]